MRRVLLDIDPRSEQPIYDQIVRQIKFAVASGSIKPGMLVPSVRELAKDLVVNPNTVARAYRELQADDVLESVRGQGMRVTAKAGRTCVSERKEMIRRRLEQVLREALLSNLSREEIEAMVERELDKSDCKSSLQGKRSP